MNTQGVNFAVVVVFVTRPRSFDYRSTTRPIDLLSKPQNQTVVVVVAVDVAIVVIFKYPQRNPQTIHPWNPGPNLH